MTSVTIPKSVEKISEDAFQNCGKMMVITNKGDSNRIKGLYKWEVVDFTIHHQTKEYIWSYVLNVWRRGCADGGDRGVFDGWGVGGGLLQFG